jgi:hypothetical protein
MCAQVSGSMVIDSPVRRPTSVVRSFPHRVILSHAIHQLPHPHHTSILITVCHRSSSIDSLLSARRLPGNQGHICTCHNPNPPLIPPNGTHLDSSGGSTQHRVDRVAAAPPPTLNSDQLACRTVRPRMHSPPPVPLTHPFARRRESCEP